MSALAHSFFQQRRCTRLQHTEHRATCREHTEGQVRSAPALMVSMFTGECGPREPF